MRTAHAGFVSRAAVLALLTAAGLAAQLDRRASSIRGEIASDSGDPLATAGLTVELLDTTNHMVVDRVSSSGAGSFEFIGLAAGDYEVRVLDRGGNPVRSEYVQVSQSSNYVTVRLPPSNAARPVSGQVSLAQLSHKVPKPALKEFRKASDAEEKREWDKAIQHLQKAVEIDPAYVEAYNNLGARYMHAQQFDKALEEFQKAYALDRNAMPVVSNLAIAYLTLERYAEAERTAREAVKLDSTSNKARFALGLSLQTLRRDDDEALENLGAAAREFPRAHVAAAELLARRGDSARAAAELRKYLRTGDTRDRAQVEAWLAQLEQAQAMARTSGQ